MSGVVKSYNSVVSHPKHQMLGEGMKAKFKLNLENTKLQYCLFYLHLIGKAAETSVVDTDINNEPFFFETDLEKLGFSVSIEPQPPHPTPPPFLNGNFF